MFFSQSPTLQPRSQSVACLLLGSEKTVGVFRSCGQLSCDLKLFSDLTHNLRDIFIPCYSNFDDLLCVVILVRLLMEGRAWVSKGKEFFRKN